MAAYVLLYRREILTTPTIHGTILQRLHKNLKVLSAVTKVQFLCKRAGINPFKQGLFLLVGSEGRIGTSLGPGIAMQLYSRTLR